MFIPKVNVSMIDPEANVRFIQNYLSREKTENSTRPFYEKTISLYPELENIPDIEDEKKRGDVIREAVIKRLEDKRPEIETRMQHFREVFDSFIYEFIVAQCQLFNYEWKEKDPEISCYVGYLPFYPRSATEKCFYVSFHDEERVFSGAVHEINHMIFFEKWNEMHGGNCEEKLWPDPLWFLEEIIVDPTLNDKRVKCHTLYENRAYPMFYEKDEKSGISIMDRVKNCYEESSCIEDFLEKAFELIYSWREKNRR